MEEVGSMDKAALAAALTSRGVVVLPRAQREELAVRLRRVLRAEEEQARAEAAEAEARRANEELQGAGPEWLPCKV